MQVVLPGWQEGDGVEIKVAIFRTESPNHVLGILWAGTWCGTHTRTLRPPGVCRPRVTCSDSPSPGTHLGIL